MIAGWDQGILGDDNVPPMKVHACSRGIHSLRLALRQGILRSSAVTIDLGIPCLL